MDSPLQSTAPLADDYHPSALADIYQDSISMAVWRRQLEGNVSHYAVSLAQRSPCFQTRFIQSPTRVLSHLQNELPLGKHRQAFICDVALVVDMFACLFELKAVGVRLAVLNKAMCPKFHVDHVPCRLLCTYTGAGTLWHDHAQVRRFDNGSLAPLSDARPNQLNAGDVALLKGESWVGNEGRGQVHCSPEATDASRRLVLTLDFAPDFVSNLD